MAPILSVSELLDRLASETKSRLQELLKVHSSVHHEPSKHIGGELQSTPWGMRRTGGVFCVGYEAWNPLSPDGVRAQASALASYRSFSEIARILLKDQPSRVVRSFEEFDHQILAAIEQTSSPSDPDRVCEALDGIMGVVRNLYDAATGEVIYVPDTNALLYNPDLENWSFSGTPRFKVLLLPTILSELDELKVRGHQQLRDKAEGLITRIKGYRARGQLTVGVPLRRDVSTLVTWAVEPNLAASLSWLDGSNSDDRFLAGFLEVMRKHPHSSVVLVTRDLNLQNKAELARLPYGEPPAPAAGSTK